MTVMQRKSTKKKAKKTQETTHTRQEETEEKNGIPREQKQGAKASEVRTRHEDRLVGEWETERTRAESELELNSYKYTVNQPTNRQTDIILMVCLQGAIFSIFQLFIIYCYCTSSEGCEREKESEPVAVCVRARGRSRG